MEVPESTEEESVSLDIVGVYAERLSAVTHAFALCCKTMQKANGRYSMVLTGTVYTCDCIVQ